MATFEYQADPNAAPQPTAADGKLIVRLPMVDGSRREYRIVPGTPFEVVDAATIAALRGDRKFRELS